MRGALCVVLAVAALAAAGCGSSEESEWRGPPTAGADGTVPVDGFVAYQESVQEDWERSAALAAAQFLDLGARVATTKSIQSEPSKDDDDGETVRVDLDGLPDDPVRAERWTLVLEREDGVYRIVSARRVVACMHGRGHEDFSTEPCR